MGEKSDVEKIAALFQKHRDELGFVNTAQVREKTTYVEWDEDTVVGAAIVNHCVRKPQTTLYDIAVDENHRRCGIATSLISSIVKETPHKKIIAKCPTELDANSFYDGTGWTCIETEDGKSRSLNVWKYEVDN